MLCHNRNSFSKFFPGSCKNFCIKLQIFFSSTIQKASCRHNFNPCFRKESDNCARSIITSPNLFQSTLSQGKWPVMPLIFLYLRKFQSTLPQGKWHVDGVLRFSIQWFQSTLPQEKWADPALIWAYPLRFQSALPQGKWLKLLVVHVVC